MPTEKPTENPIPKPKLLHCSECGAPVPSASPHDESAGVMCLECADGITEKPIANPEHTCYICGEPAEYSIEATDLNFTDQGTEYITYDEWFCAEHYEQHERTKGN